MHYHILYLTLYCVSSTILHNYAYASLPLIVLLIFSYVVAILYMQAACRYGYVKTTNILSVPAQLSSEQCTVDVDGVQVADLTADEVQSLAINHVNGSVTLSLPLTQRLSESAVTVNMTKFNTVLTNRSDDMGNIVTEMVTWGTSAVFGEAELPTT